jgi:lipopolysaccharide/colanic/teichoic acid biosynthesis glycosyltransferase
MERLAKEVSNLGGEASVLAEFVPSRWRELMGSGRSGRLRARLRSFLTYPPKAIWDASFGEAEVSIPTTNPFTLPAIMVMMRAAHGRMVVPLIYDLYPDAMEVAGVAKSRGPAARIAAALNRMMVKNADGVVFIGRRMAERVIRQYGQPKRYTVIETGADTQEFSAENLGDESPQSELEAFAESHLTLSYVGAMGAMHDWVTLAQALPRLLDLDPKIGVVIAATGPGVTSLKEELKDLDPERCRFVPPLADQAWARLLVRSDVSLVSLRDQARHTSCPSKTYSAMAAGSAVLAIAPSDSDLGDVIVQSQGGALIKNGDSDGVVSQVSAWLQDPETLKITRERARMAASTRWEMRVLAKRWETFLKETRAARSASRRPPISKRAMDIALGGAGLLALSPLLGGLALAVGATMGRPVFFRQERPGLGAKTFELMKFRTMKDPKPGEEDPEFDGARITRLGRFMRSTSLDELPTLLNVIKGDMSLVGPRPLLVRYLDRYSDEQGRRHDVLPGLTGWAQINGRNATTWDERFRHDLWYVDNRTFLRDVGIVLRTVKKVFVREGISQEGHATMPEFMGLADGGGGSEDGVVIPIKGATGGG